MWHRQDSELDLCGDWLVTNITQELSVGHDTIPRLENSMYDLNYLKSERLDESCDNLTYEYQNEYINEETVFEERLYEETLVRDHTSSSGSGSEASYQCISSQPNSEELDTPPTTPPNVTQNVEQVRIITANDLSFFPVSSIGKCKTAVTNSTKAIAAKTCQTFNAKGSQIANNITSCKEYIHDQQLRRRQERMIRNRESAYLSRKRAKEHVSQLERQVQELAQQNSKLLQENALLRERLSSYEGSARKVGVRRFPHVPKKTTALLIISITLCFNIHSLRLFEEGVSSDGGGVQVAPYESHHAGTRSLLWVDPLDHHTLSNLTTSCPVPINKSESLRLERELREWIGTEVPARTGPANISTRRNKRIPRARRPRTFPLDMWSGMTPSLFGLEGLYGNIERRPDTFYLVSFSPDHLLLPAMATNETSRPKISVMLPASLVNSSGRVEMMQIDCEVTNTQLLSVREQLIPLQLRPIHKFINQSFPTSEGVYENNAGKNETGTKYNDEESNRKVSNETFTKSRKPSATTMVTVAVKQQDKIKSRNITESRFNMLFPFRYYPYAVNNSNTEINN